MAHVKSGNEDLDNGEGPEVEEESDRSDVVGVTNGAQRGAAAKHLCPDGRKSNSASNDTQYAAADVGQNTEFNSLDDCSDEEQNEQSEAYVSSAEGFNSDDESDDDGVLYQLREPEPVIKKTQPRVSRKKTVQSTSAVGRKSRDNAAKSPKMTVSRTTQSYEPANNYPSRSAVKQKKSITEEGLRGRSRTSRFDVVADGNRGSMRMMHQTRRTGRSIDDDNQIEPSEAYVSSVEEFNLSRESDDDDVLYQLAEPKTMVKMARPLSSGSEEETSISRRNERSHQMQRSLPGNIKGRKNSRAVTTKAFEMNVDSGTDCHDLKHKGCTTVKKPSRRSKSSQTGNVEKRPMRIVQQGEYTGRSAVDDRHRVGFKLTSSPCMRKVDRQYDRSLSPESFYSDDEQIVDRRQSKFPSRTGKYCHEFSHRNQRSDGRESMKENYFSSDNSDVKMRSKYASRSKSSYASDSSPDRYYESDTHCRTSGRMKPEKFDGSSCFETFLVQFNNCAQFNSWDERDKLHYLRWTLTGPAAQMLWGTEGMTYRQLIARLRSRFGSHEMEEKYQAELQCRRRNTGESLRELAQDIRRLMILAYSDNRSPMSERLAKEHFIVAIDEPELELKVREKEPQTLDAALKYAQRLEIYKNAVRQRRQRFARMVTAEPDTPPSSPERRTTEDDRSQQKPQQLHDTPKKQNRPKNNKTSQSNKSNKKEGSNGNKRACATSVGNEDKWKDELLKKVQDLELNQQKVNAENTALNKEVERLRYLEQLRSVPTPASSTATAQTVRPLLPPSTSTQSKACFHCGVIGHIARFCPQKTAGAAPVMHSRGMYKRTQSRISGMRETSSLVNEAYLRVSINGQVYSCLLDTGSEVSLFPESVIGTTTIGKTHGTLKVVNGSEIPVLGEVNLNVKIGSYSTQVVGLVSEHIPEPMLGIDFLTKNKVMWDFDKGKIWMAGKPYPLHQCPDKHTWCRRVMLEEDVVIPARSEATVPTKMQFRRIPNSLENTDWSTESSCVKEGIHVSRTLVPHDSWSNIPVLVMNVKKEPISLKCNTVMSTLQEVDVVGEEQQNISSEIQDGSAGKDNVIPEFLQKMLDGVDPSIPESTCLALEAILLRHVGVFSKDENDLGETNIMMHHIDTGDARPVRQPLRRYPATHVEAISEHVDSMLKQGTIEPASSPWASNVVLVKKKDGSFRCCVDYLQLNSVTRKDIYPLPRIDDCLDAMSSATLFSTFDLRSSYHQIQVAPQDRDKTTFICLRGMYRYRNMPFGLCNAGATFQRLMDVVMSGLHFEVCLVYLDDIVLFSRTCEEHLERLVRVLGRLESAGLKLKPEKCNLMQKSVSFLGHVVSGEGIATDPAKTKLVSEWPVPTSVKEVRSFLGLAGYYRRFVKGYATIATPLNHLMKKDQPFEWTDKTQEAFETLKNALTSSPVLAMPNDRGEFVLDTDACDRAIGAVLSQI